MLRQSVFFYFLFLLAVGGGRLLEMRLSRRNRRALLQGGAHTMPDPFFPAMVTLHASILIGALVEVIVFDRVFDPAIGVPALLVFALCNLLRWWVIRSLAAHWNVNVIDSAVVGVVTRGPYRWIRHPNYVAVFIELLAVPLVHGAWITALVGAILHTVVLRGRIVAEERALLANPAYVQAMAGKARFVPGVF